MPPKRKDCKSDLTKVYLWASKAGFTIIRGSDGTEEVDFEAKTIAINHKNWEETRLHHLLHECGHIIIEGSKWRPPTMIKRKEYFDSEEKDCLRKHNDKYKISIIAEEIEAWEQGKKLAKKLQIKLNKEKYNRDAARCVMTYVNWAAK